MSCSYFHSEGWEKLETWDGRQSGALGWCERLHVDEIAAMRRGHDAAAFVVDARMCGPGDALCVCFPWCDRVAMHDTRVGLVRLVAFERVALGVLFAFTWPDANVHLSRT